MVGIGLAAMDAFKLSPSLPYSTWPDAAQWLTVFVRLNLAIVIFNLLPLFPLDGYWLIHAVLPLPALARWEGAAGRTTLILGIGIAAILMMPAAWLSAIYLPVVLTVSRVVLGW
jgi:Zn-dependent protease